jgi:hypothetical protein
MKKKIILLAMVIGSFCIYAFSPVSTGDWVTYKSKSGKFECLFPVKPEETKDEKDGKTTIKLKAKSGTAVYAINASIHKNKLEATPENLQKSFDAFVKKLNGTVEKKETFKVSTYEGTEANIKGDKDAHVNYRIIIIEKTLLQFTVTSVKAYAPDADVRMFFDSFKINEPADKK